MAWHATNGAPSLLKSTTSIKDRAILLGTAVRVNSLNILKRIEFPEHAHMQCGTQVYPLRWTVRFACERLNRIDQITERFLAEL